MRFDLKVSFAERDAVKKLGARWDAAAKVWYVVDKDDMAPFSKWLPVLNELGSSAPTQKTAPARTETTGKVIVGSNYVEHPRVCECLPWDVCDKCRATELSI